MDVVQLDELKIVGLKVEAPFADLAHLVPHAWRELEERLDEIGQLATRTRFYGVFPLAVHIEPVELFTYWVGAQVEEAGAVPAGMESLTIPAQIYAMVRCHGGRPEIRDCYRALAAWIEEQGYERVPTDLGFELYDVGRQAPFETPVEFDYDVYEPVRNVGE